jgi:type II secretory pathway component GspD/PulD (secretin)
MIVPINDPDTELISRSYSVLPSFVERISNALAEMHEPNKWSSLPSSTGTPEDDFKKFFAQMGVQWPIGSSIMCFENQLRVSNTLDNLEILEQILFELNVIPALVNVDVQMVAFRMKDIEKLQLAGGMTKEALLGLQKAGKAKLVATASAEVEPDQEAIVKVTQEILYPSEFNVQIAAANAHSWAPNFRGVLWVCEPQNFTMRETGMILQVIPKVEDNALISLNLKPQWVTLDRWEVIPAGFLFGRSPFRQPVFGVTSFETQVTITDGDTVLLGNSSTTDGKWVNVGFLTVKKTRTQPQQ